MLGVGMSLARYIIRYGRWFLEIREERPEELKFIRWFLTSVER